MTRQTIALRAVLLRGRGLPTASTDGSAIGTALAKRLDIPQSALSCR